MSKAMNYNIFTTVKSYAQMFIYQFGLFDNYV